MNSGWLELSDRMRGCTACPELAATRTQVVPGVLGEAGESGGRLVLVGEAPGATEDETGLPFTGRAGQLLDQLLPEAGLDRRAVGVLNVLKCRPPANRKPTRAEIAHCRPWLESQLGIACPDLVLALGGTATEWFLGAGVRLGQSRGRVHLVAGPFGSVQVVVTYHPSAALRFGPAGAPLAALREDLAFVATLMRSGG